MYQQLNNNKGDNAKYDFALVIAFVVLILFFRKIIDLCATLPNPFNIITQLGFVVAMAALLLVVYNRRIATYRYSIIFKQIAEGEENIFGTDKPYPWPEGTFLVEHMVANKGRLMEQIRPEEYVALYAPGEKVNEKVTFFHKNSFTGKLKKTEYTLVYKRDNKLYSAAIHPDDVMLGHLREAMDAK